jgi:hypothetical protein
MEVYYRAIVVWRCGTLENKFNNVNSPRNQCQRGKLGDDGEGGRKKERQTRKLEAENWLSLNNVNGQVRRK